MHKYAPSLISAWFLVFFFQATTVRPKRGNAPPVSSGTKKRSPVIMPATSIAAIGERKASIVQLGQDFRSERHMTQKSPINYSGTSSRPSLRITNCQKARPNVFFGKVASLILFFLWYCFLMIMFLCQKFELFLQCILKKHIYIFSFPKMNHERIIKL